MSRILLIEDEPTLRRALRIALEKSGHEADEASDGREGLAKYKSRAFDLVVTDLIMPEMEGMETIRAIRRINPQIKIIAISGGGRGTADNYLQLAQHFGANAVFAKPFELNDLCSAVAVLLDEEGTKPLA